MASISEVPGITGSTLELFKAAGFVTVDSLLDPSVPEILAKLDGANAAYEVAVRLPSETAVKAWQNAAKELVRGGSRGRVLDLPPEAMRQARDPAPPAASVVSEDQLRAAGIDVDSVPVARAPGEPAESQSAKMVTPEDLAEAGFELQEGQDPPVKQKSSSPPKASARRRAGRLPSMPAPAAEKKEGERAGKERTGAQERGGKDERGERNAGAGRSRESSESPRRSAPTKPAVKKSAAKKPVAEKSASRKSASRKSVQKKPAAERRPAPADPPEAKDAPKPFRQMEVERSQKPPVQRRNRGMSHPDAGQVRLAATVTVFAPLISLTTAGVLIYMLVMANLKGWEFHWTMALLLLVFPVCLFFYLAIGTKARCRLCGQRLFVPRTCRKHERAKRSIFGYTFAVARDAMLFAGYRCMLCGTKTRLKD